MPHVVNGLVSNGVNTATANVTINGYTPGGEQFIPSDFNFTTATVSKIIPLMTNGDQNPGQFCTDIGGGKLKIASLPNPSSEQALANALAFRMTLTLFVIGS